MKQSVYIETSVISYLTARPSRDLIVAAHQEITREWWERRRADFEVFVSGFVLEEATQGDIDAAKRRTDVIADLAELLANDEVERLAEVLLIEGALPEQARYDALHIAVAAINGVDYLLTWNCKHIANVEKLSHIEALCRAEGYEPPRVCTPIELLEV
jgi:hypothetical protein